MGSKMEEVQSIYVPSTFKRILAFSVDQFLVLFLYLPFMNLFWSVYFENEDIYISLGSFFVFIFLPAIYEFVSLVLWQATPGQLMNSFKVISASKSSLPLSLEQCFLRSIMGRFSLFFSWAIYAVALLKTDRTGLPDWVAETRVVQFVPRSSTIKIRWILGPVLIVLYAFEGLTSSSNLWQEIDWENKQVELRRVLELDSLDTLLSESDFELEEFD
jgi:uncharacterized RDD family membrane protein YckC